MSATAQEKNADKYMLYLRFMALNENLWSANLRSHIASISTKTKFAGCLVLAKKDERNIPNKIKKSGKLCLTELGMLIVCTGMVEQFDFTRN